jgi:Protein of unknown function (DUF3040)
MSLPAWQQRALERIEGALQASEPHLASMFAIFARLNASEPVGEEPLARPRTRSPGSSRRRRRSPAGSAIYAIVLIPVMFTMIVLGAVLGGTAHTATNCDGYSVAGNSPLIIRPTCQATGKATSPKTTSGTRSAPCAATALAARPAIWTGSELALPLPAGTDAAAGNAPGMCYKLPRDGGSVADRAPGT